MNSTPAPRTEPLAIVSLVLAILSFIMGPLGSVPAIILGHLARARVRRDPALGGDGLAVAGLSIGYIFLGLAIAGAFFFSSRHGIEPLR